MYDSRPKDTNITFSGPFASTHDIKSRVSNGDSVELRIESLKISIQNIQQIESGIYKGTIRKFGPAAIQSKGLKKGQEVKFSYAQIFACS